jgi:hypothetical protein
MMEGTIADFSKGAKLEFLPDATPCGGANRRCGTRMPAGDERDLRGENRA